MSNTTDVLLAEDEEHIAKLVAFKLGREGLAVTIARNGQEAIDRFSEKKWALVILDVMMPVADGWHALKALRARQELAQVPVLMLTAKGHQKDMAEAAELGATRFLRKPFDPAELAQIVKAMISGHADGLE